MNKIEILWIDDEIDLLKIHILFLERKGYLVSVANNGFDALEMIKKKRFDIVFLDENMPGKTGLEILPDIKIFRPTMPVVMITKSEEEDIMEQAIGSQIDDYLIKPVNPNQIILSIKKNVENKRIVSEKTSSAYQGEFYKLGNQIADTDTSEQWIDTYKKLVYWELKLESSEEGMMDEMLRNQKDEANNSFVKFIKNNYENWFVPDAERPNMPFDFFRKKVFPITDSGESAFVILIDNLRYDQWKIIQPAIGEYMKTESEELWFTMLPTSTQYARNAFFAGLTPLEISKRYPEFWLNDEDEGGKNAHEKELLEFLIQRYRRNISLGYEKVLTNKGGSKIVENIQNILQNQLNVVVFNFVDMLSHARTDSKMIRELANTESAYRSLTLTWFEHSPLFDLIKELAKQKIKVFITTDHGTIRVKDPIRVIGDKNTTTNLRYKHGRNLDYKSKEVFEILNPEKAGLPISNISSKYIFANNTDFFAYPNNFNHYVRYYTDTFQHGGVSLEEMLIPVITLKS